MKEGRKILIPEQAVQDFHHIVSVLSENQTNLLNNVFNIILSMVCTRAPKTDWGMLEKEVEQILLQKFGHFSESDQVMLKRSLVAKLALNLPTIIENMKLPDSILVLYPDAFIRVANKVTKDQHNLTANPPHLGFVLGLFVPGGAQVLEVISRVKLSSVVQTVLRSKKLEAFVRYIQSKGYGSWVRIHTDTDYLTDFNEKGWDDCYLRIAEMLSHPSRKHICGMVGTSWFYDPQLTEISPNLSYLQQRPLERGAFFLRHRTGPSDIEFAIMKSNTRRRLYQERKYIPKVYSVVWPRKELIDWAGQTRRKK